MTPRTIGDEVLDAAEKARRKDMDKSTPRPWVIREYKNCPPDGGRVLIETENPDRQSGIVIAFMRTSPHQSLEEGLANARRSAASVNACSHISIENLEGGVIQQLIGILRNCLNESFHPFEGKINKKMVRVLLSKFEVKP